MKNVSFGSWLRWTIARREIQRAELGRVLGISQGTISNIYRRESPQGINDVTIARLAALLGMSEPELMTKYLDGLQEAAAAPKPIAKRKPTAKGKR